MTTRLPILATPPAAVAAPADYVRCDRLAATVTARTCVLRQQRARPRAATHALATWGRDGCAGEALASCRACPDGVQVAAALAKAGAR